MTSSPRRQQLIEVLSLAILEQLEDNNFYLLEHYEQLDEASFKELVQKLKDTLSKSKHAVKKGAKTAALTGGIALATMGAGKATSTGIPNVSRDSIPTSQVDTLSSDSLTKVDMSKAGTVSGRPDTINYSYKSRATNTTREWKYFGINSKNWNRIKNRIYTSLRTDVDNKYQILGAINEDSGRFSEEVLEAFKNLVELYNIGELTSPTLLQFMEALSEKYPNTFYYSAQPGVDSQKGFQPKLYYRDGKGNMFELFLLPSLAGA